MRAFVSVDITDSMVSDAISEMQKNSDLSGAVRVENMHYTLMFLGQVEDSKMGDIKRALESVEFDAFEVRCKGLGNVCFKSSWEARLSGWMLGQLQEDASCKIKLEHVSFHDRIFATIRAVHFDNPCD